MGQGDMSPDIYEWGTSMVMSPHILRVISFSIGLFYPHMSCCLLYFKANIMRSFAKSFRPPVFFYVPPIIP